MCISDGKNDNRIVQLYIFHNRVTSYYRWLWLECLCFPWAVHSCSATDHVKDRLVAFECTSIPVIFCHNSVHQQDRLISCSSLVPVLESDNSKKIISSLHLKESPELLHCVLWKKNALVPLPTAQHLHFTKSAMKRQGIDYRIINENVDAWIVASIEDVKEEELKIKYSYWTWEDDEWGKIEKEEWINGKNERLSALHSHTIKYVTLAAPPKLAWDIPPPILYTDTETQREFIIISGNAEEEEEFRGRSWYL